MPSETKASIPFKPYTKYMAYMQKNNRYHGGHKDRNEGQTFDYLRQ
jgi:hypothetical protein